MLQIEAKHAHSQKQLPFIVLRPETPAASIPCISFSKDVYLEEGDWHGVFGCMYVCRLWTRWCFCFLRPLLIRVIMRFTGPTHAACLLEVRRRDIYLEKWQRYKQTRAPYLPFNLYKPQHSLTQTLRYDQSVWYTMFMYVCVLALSTVCKKQFREAVFFFWWLIQNLKNFLQGGDVDFNWHE